MRDLRGRCGGGVGRQRRAFDDRGRRRRDGRRGDRRRRRRTRGVSAREAVGDRAGRPHADPRFTGPPRPPRGIARVGQLHPEGLGARRPVGGIGRQRVHDHPPRAAAGSGARSG